MYYKATILFVFDTTTMAKKKGRDADKKAALAAKKDAKQEKAIRKRLSKESRMVGGEDHSSSDDDSDNTSSDHDIDRLFQQYKQQNVVTDGPCKITSSDNFPLARANATFTVTDDTKKKDAYLFGGEYHDGANTVVSDQLFKYELTTSKWKQLVCSSAPPPRCAHSAVYYNRALYVFGGELASATEYHHYRDVWKFDIVKLQWTEIKPATLGGTTPSARSGAAATVWKHFMIIFGGFYEAADSQPRWYNDITVLNLQTEQWHDIPHSKLTVRPEPRSACNAALIGEEQWLIHGGFSKLLAGSKLQQPKDDAAPVSETFVHTDAWILHLKPLLSGKPPTWERWTSSLSRAKRKEAAVISPNGRSGVGAISYNRNNVLLFGGVVDQELHHHKLESVFFNDLYIFHVEKRRFIPIRVSAATTTNALASSVANNDKTNKDAPATDNYDLNDDEDDGAADDLVQEQSDISNLATVSGWDLHKLRSNMFAFVDGNGNVVYEKIDSVMKGRAEKDQSKESESEEEKDESKKSKEPTSSSEKFKRRLEPPSSLIVERTEPLPRIKPCLFMNGNTLYVYGGLLEVGDREVTLDDMWSIDLRKNRNWTCTFPGTMHQQVWRGAVNDDDDSYYSNNTGGNADGEMTDSDNEPDNKVKEAEKREESSSGSRKQEIAKLAEKYQLEDVNRTPQPDEVLADFYARTSDYWNGKAAEQGVAGNNAHVLSSKELKREGFALARVRFEVLEPIIERLMNLKLQRKLDKTRKTETKQNTKKFK